MADGTEKPWSKYNSSTTAEQVVEMENINLTGKNIMVTGATSGIGKETARVLYNCGGNIFIACRDIAKAEIVANEIRSAGKDGAGSLEIIPLDLTSLQSVRQAAETYNKKNIPLHVLINNAGVMACPYAETADGFEMQMGTNHFGPFLLTNLLMDALKAGQPSRIVNVSSLGHSMDGGKIYYDDLKGKGTWNRGLTGPWYAYAQSKTANILFASELDRRFKAEGLDMTAFSLHPGSIRTELTRHLGVMRLALLIASPFLKSIPQGAATSVFLATSPAVTPYSGGYFSDCQPAVAAPGALDADNAKRLWDMSVKAVGL